MKSYNILAVDGGGIRSLIPAIWLDHLQEKLNYPLHHYFDLVAGTSSGSFITCGIAAGLDTRSIVELLYKETQTAFPAFDWSDWKNLGHLFRDPYRHPIYEGAAMEQFLKQAFGEQRFCDLLIRPTLATGYDLLNHRIMIFSNTHPDFATLPVWEICKASAAIPVMFPPHVMTLKGQSIPCIDGAMAAKNPTVCAIAEVLKANKQSVIPIQPEQLLVASFGVGEVKPQSSQFQARRWRVLSSAIPLIHAAIEGPTDTTDYVTQQMIAESRYFRFQTSLEGEDDIGNTSPAYMHGLIDAAKSYIDSHEGSKKLEQIAQHLQRDREPLRIKIYLSSAPNSERAVVQSDNHQVYGDQKVNQATTLLQKNISAADLKTALLDSECDAWEAGDSNQRNRARANQLNSAKVKSFSKVGVLGIASFITLAGISGHNWFPNFPIPGTQPSTAAIRSSHSSNILPVEVLSIQPESSYSVQRNYTGTIASGRTSKLGFERTGQLVNVRVNAGDRVEAGKILADLDTQSLQIQAREFQAKHDQAVAQLHELQAGARPETIAAAEAAVRRLEAQLDLAQTQRDRRQTLYHQGAVSLEQLDEAMSQVNALQAQMDEANNQLQEQLAGTRKEQIQAQMAVVEELAARQENLTVEQEKSGLIAPFSGTIGDRFVDEGTVVAAGQPIISLVEAGMLEARIGVPKTTAEQLHLGSSQQVQVGEKIYSAELTAILPEVDASTRTVTLVLQLEPAATTTVSPGQITRLQLAETIPAQGYWLPTTALIGADRGLWSCYVLGEAVSVDGSKAFEIEQQRIEILHTEGDRVFVRGTLQAGDRIILNGIHRLTPGQLVTVS